MKRLLQLFLVALALYCCVSQSHNFDEWKVKNNRRYISEEEHEYRSMVFAANVQRIHKHNSDSSQTWKMRLNHMADMTQTEFSGQRGEMSPNTKAPEVPLVDVADTAGSSHHRNLQSVTPVDWEAQGKVSPIKTMVNAAYCPYAYVVFAAAAAIESAFLMKDGTVVDVSEQHLFDCANITCQSNPTNSTLAAIPPQLIINQAMLLAINQTKTVGVLSEQTRPWSGNKNATNCPKYPPGAPIIKISSSQNVSYSSCSDISSALLGGPLAVYVDTTNWMFYGSGIVSNCGGSLPSNYVLLVGVDSTAWKLKGIFGSGWGESGYIRLAYGNTCFLCNPLRTYRAFPPLNVTIPLVRPIA